jgi:hypothetical protein
MKRLWLWLCRLTNPWLCPKCGEYMHRLHPSRAPRDWPAEDRAMLLYCYTCPNGCLGDRGVMLF